jgi:hypothetical protein
MDLELAGLPERSKVFLEIRQTVLHRKIPIVRNLARPLQRISAAGRTMTWYTTSYLLLPHADLTVRTFFLFR